MGMSLSAPLIFLTKETYRHETHGVVLKPIKMCHQGKVQYFILSPFIFLDQVERVWYGYVTERTPDFSHKGNLLP